MPRVIQKKLPCPRLEDFKCLKEFGTAESARAHGKTHASTRQMFLCPRADDLKCPETFLSAVAARHHGDTHGGKKYACPGADKNNCELFFIHIGSAMSHLRCCHTHKFECRHRGCPKRFETAQEASEHADMEHRHLLFLCPFKDCQSRVAGVRLLKYEFHTNHRNFHIRHGQLDPSDDFRPLRDVELDRSSKTQLYQLILHQKGSSTDNSSCEHNPCYDGNNDDDDGDDDYFESEDQFFSGSWEDTENENVFTNTELSTEYQRRVEAVNLARWTRFIQSTGGHVHTVAFRTLGRTCLGPMPIEKGLVVKTCPNETGIDFDTAKLRPGINEQSCPMLPARCVSCDFNVKLRQRLAHLGWEFVDSAKTCQQASCKEPTFYGTRMCVKHVAAAVIDYGIKANTAGLDYLPELRKFFNKITEKTWSLPSSLHRSLADIQAGKTPGTALVVLDIEFSITSGQVWEVSMIEQVSGKVLLNTTIEHEHGIDHSYRIASSSRFQEFISRSKAEAVYSSMRESIISQMDVHQVAIKLKEIGINQNTTFLTWHKSTTDLKLLRRFLQLADYADILPPDENCVPLIPIFRLNFPEKVKDPANRRSKSFPLALEVLFPVIFPRHSLIGLNHQALVDCQQTRLVLQAAIELTKPVEERGKGWNPERITRNSQTSIRNWLTGHER